MAGFIFIFLAPILLFIFNSLTNQLCVQKAIQEDQQALIFRTINVLITILLLCAYIENTVT